MRSIPDVCLVTDLDLSLSLNRLFANTVPSNNWGSIVFHGKRRSEMGQLNDTSGRFDMTECVLILISFCPWTVNVIARPRETKTGPYLLLNWR
jgi:hypothetical protein